MYLLKELLTWHSINWQLVRPRGTCKVMDLRTIQCKSELCSDMHIQSKLRNGRQTHYQTLTPQVYFCRCILIDWTGSKEHTKTYLLSFISSDKNNLRSRYDLRVQLRPYWNYLRVSVWYTDTYVATPLTNRGGEEIRNAVLHYWEHAWHGANVLLCMYNNVIMAVGIVWSAISYRIPSSSIFLWRTS